jgi:hypothetical protein
MYAELLISHRAILTDTTASVMVADNAVSNLDTRRGTGRQFLNHTARLMAGDHIGWLRTSVAMKICTAKSGRTYL